MLSTGFKFLLALCVTFLDVFVGGRYGGVLWFVWGPDPFARIGLLLLAGAIVFTLADIWSQTILQRHRAAFLRPSLTDASVFASSSIQLERADV